jgi:phage recombination protein Bet
MTDVAVASPRITPDELALVKNTVAQGATDAELKLFLFDCARQSVHPLDRLLHFTKRNGKYTPITSIDFMRIRAAESGEMAGSDDPMFRDSGKGYPAAATVTVHRLTQGQRFGYEATARWSEYYPGDGPPGFMWRKMPHTMLGKCAEALALRKGFPRQLAGLYAKEEMDQADALTSPVIASSVVEPARQPDADLPAGARRVVKVGPGKAGAAAEVTLDTGESFLTWRKPVATVAQQFCDAGTMCVPTFATSASGNRRLETLTAWRADLELVPDEHAEPPLDDIAF